MVAESVEATFQVPIKERQGIGPKLHLVPQKVLAVATHAEICVRPTANLSFHLGQQDNR